MSTIPLAISAFFSDSNYAEACLWAGIGVAFAIAAICKAGVVRRDSIVTAITFLFFGASDWVEAHTGAWWRPWWLLVWKGLCLLVFLWLLVRHYRRKRA